jgi:hypothetical protein
MEELPRYCTLRCETINFPINFQFAFHSNISELTNYMELSTTQEATRC